MDVDLNPKMFWRLVGMRAVGCAVVTAQDHLGPAGFLALSATHLSAAPPRMMVSISTGTAALATVRNARHFAINYLAEGSEELVDVFGGRTAAKGADRFLGYPWSTLVTGAPTLGGAVGCLDCKLEELIDQGGAVITIGRIVAFSESSRRPLISFSGGLARLAEPMA